MKCGANFWKAFIIFIVQGQRFIGDKQAANGEEHDRKSKWEEHNAHKFTRGNIELGVDIKILRVPEGGKHASEIGGNVLKNEYGSHIFFLAGRRERYVAQWQEGKKCHIVRKKHRAYKGNIYQRNRKRSCVAGALDYLSSGYGEESDVFQSADYCQSAEKAG
jgi:hypothetical protein